MSPSDAPSPGLSERRLVMVMVDAAGFTKAIAPLSSMQLAQLVDDFYGLLADAIERSGGRVVKFVGDGCLAVYDESQAVAAVQCVRGLSAAVRELGTRFGVALDVGANVHLSVVVEGEFGHGESRRYDLMGAGVFHVFRMGAGVGVRISESVYRQLPNEDRGPWKKQQPPATYTLQAATS